MSIFVHALALFPALAAAIVAIAALADRREAVTLNALRALDETARDHAAPLHDELVTDGCAA